MSCQQEFTAISNQRRAVGELLDADWRAGPPESRCLFLLIAKKVSDLRQKVLRRKLELLNQAFRKCIGTFGALALQDFSHRLLKVGHFQWLR